MVHVWASQDRVARDLEQAASSWTLASCITKRLPNSKPYPTQMCIFLLKTELE